MKRWLITAAAITIVLLTIALFVALFLPSHFPDWSWRLGWDQPEPTPYVSERHQQLSALDAAAKPGGVVMIGDSYVEQFDPTYFNTPVRTMAAGGDTVRHITQRIPDWQSLPNQQAVIIWAGYNDLLSRNPDIVAQDMERLLAALPPAVPIVLIAPVPVRDDAQNQLVTQLAGLYQSQCSTIARCQFVDTSTALAGSDGRLDARFDRGDGVHLNAAGYAQLAPRIEAALDER